MGLRSEPVEQGGDLVAAVALGQLQGTIAAVQHVGEVPVRAAESGEAAADVQLEVGMGVHAGHGGDGTAKPFGKGEGLIGIAVDQQQGEFLIPQAAGEILLPQETAGKLADIVQHRVAGVMPPALVDLAEVVDVEAEQGQGMALLAGSIEFPLAKAEEGAACRQPGDGAEMGLVAQFQLPHHQLGQPPELLLLEVGDLARLAIDHAERAEVVTLGAAEGRAGIEADVGCRPHQWVGAKALIGQGIGHHQHLVAGDGVGTEGHLPGGFLHPEALAGEEPLPVGLHQGDGNDRGVEDRGRQLHDAFEVLVAGHADHPMALQIPQPLRLVGGDRIGRVGGHGVMPGGVNARRI